MTAVKGKDGKRRCGWAGGGKPHYEAYHDEEWGVPVRDDRGHFEMLILEGAQAGLSWETVLKKREGYAKAFKNFDPARAARMTDKELEARLKDPGIIRSRLKVFGVRRNARVFLDIQKEIGSFDAYVRGFTGARPRINAWRTMAEVPAETEESRALSKDLKKRGMTFTGPVIIYAYMQAAGLVNDHLVSCWRYKPCGG